ncbi:hypothetical protein AB0M20_29655 [Actinoplanes sp. NPDC051633]|uniref:hypothetical protein n=1 Tax=Actinoplanes sp. NPDC051633 TaxID=3155670 RepID=UPI003428563A
MKGYTASSDGKVYLYGKRVGTVQVPLRLIMSVLGDGANGIAFGAWHEALARDEVIKVYPPRVDLGEGPDEFGELRDKAMAEASKAAALSHPAIATVYEFNVLMENGVPADSTGWPYVVQQHRRGEPLGVVLSRMTGDAHGRRYIVRQIFDALAYAERRGCLHGDLHMNNVLVRLGSAQLSRKSPSSTSVRAR